MSMRKCSWSLCCGVLFEPIGGNCAMEALPLGLREVCMSQPRDDCAWPMCVLPFAPEEAQGSPLVQLSVRRDSERAMWRVRHVVGLRGSTACARSVVARMMAGCAVLCSAVRARIVMGLILGGGRSSRACVKGFVGHREWNGRCGAQEGAVAVRGWKQEGMPAFLSGTGRSWGRSMCGW
jgi:hypothetical protein